MSLSVAELVELVHAEIQHGLAGIEETQARADGRIAHLTDLELELPTDVRLDTDAETGHEMFLEGSQRDAIVALELTPGEGGGRISFSFVAGRNTARDRDSTPVPVTQQSVSGSGLFDSLPAGVDIDPTRVAAIGLNTVGALATADPETVSEQAEVEQQVAEVVVNAAGIYALGTEPSIATALAAAGFTPNRIADADPLALVEAVATADDIDTQSTLPYATADELVDRATTAVALGEDDSAVVPPELGHGWSGWNTSASVDADRSPGRQKHGRGPRSRRDRSRNP